MNIQKYAIDHPLTQQQCELAGNKINMMLFYQVRVCFQDKNQDTYIVADSAIIDIHVDHCNIHIKNQSQDAVYSYLVSISVSHNIHCYWFICD